MTETLVNVFGTWYEMGLQPVPPSSLMWGPSSWINKGISLASSVAGGGNSASMAALAQLNNSSSPIRSFNSAGFNTVINGGNNATTPLFVIPTSDHPRQPVYVYKGASGTGPSAYPPGSGYPSAQQATLLNVPVPLGGNLSTPFEVYYGKTLEATSSDHHMAIYDPWSDEYWEFQGFHTINTAGATIEFPSTTWLPPTGVTGYYYGCTQGGHLPNVSTSTGLFSALSDLSTPGAAASGVALAAGLVTFDDIMRGVIPHQLNLAMNCENHFIAPACKSDQAFIGPSTIVVTATGATDYSLALPLGSIYRLPSSWTAPPLGDTITSHTSDSYKLAASGLGSNSGQVVTKWHQMVWTAMRDFGFTLMDFSGSVAFTEQGTNSLDTIYSPWTQAQITAQLAALGSGGSPGGPAGTAPWSLVQQVQWPF